MQVGVMNDKTISRLLWYIADVSILRTRLGMKMKLVRGRSRLLAKRDLRYRIIAFLCLLILADQALLVLEYEGIVSDMAVMVESYVVIFMLVMLCVYTVLVSPLYHRFPYSPFSIIHHCVLSYKILRSFRLT